MLPPLDGSWEATACALEEAAEEFVETTQKVDYDESVLLIATYPDKGVLCVCNYWNAKAERCYEATWEVKDGKPVWTGVPKEVEITTNIGERAAGVVNARKAASIIPMKGAGKAPWAKAAKISAKNRDRVSQAKTHVAEVNGRNVDDVSKTLLGKAIEHLDGVLADTAAADAQDGDSGTNPKAASVRAAGLAAIAAIVGSGADGLVDAEEVMTGLKTVVDATRRHKEAADWAALNKQFGIVG